MMLAVTKMNRHSLFGMHNLDWRLVLSIQGGELGFSAFAGFSHLG